MSATAQLQLSLDPLGQDADAANGSASYKSWHSVRAAVESIKELSELAHPKQQLGADLLVETTGVTGLFLGNSKSNVEATRNKNIGRSREICFLPLQEWEGVVLDISEDGFYSRLVDLSNPKIIEEGEFKQEDVSEDQLPLLRVGAIFRWSIGYERLPGGQRRKSSGIVFRRLPAWTSKEIAESKNKADQLLAELNWDDN
ncbi:hypothetical protein V0R48_20490 [Pseudomonas alcaligenes]|uniref:hypothetical protein n=1 Tax=Aquipseudomonas alcaligenes TaxID=43263 RepID=UPI002E7BB1D5|nr:hypothetical protein [Pseudomonas alcaligenes]MEE1951357.1 hypothetical protein [Pseudomonas alcaligenes]